jgi:hypothetical protein
MGNTHATAFEGLSHVCTVLESGEHFGYSCLLPVGLVVVVCFPRASHMHKAWSGCHTVTSLFDVFEITLFEIAAANRL